MHQASTENLLRSKSFILILVSIAIQLVLIGQMIQGIHSFHLFLLTISYNDKLSECPEVFVKMVRNSNDLKRFETILQQSA